MVTAAPPTQPIPLPPAGVVVPGRSASAAAEREDWRPWVLPAVLAMLVGLFAISTPILSYGYVGTGLWQSSLEGFPLVHPVIALGSFSAVVGVLVSRRSTGLACVLATWPFLLVALIGTFVWAWWLALLAITVVAAVDKVLQAALPLFLTITVAGVYCATGIAALLPIGPVTAGTGGREVTFVLYTVVALATTAISGAIGAGVRARRRTAEAARATEHALAVETVASERARIAHDLHDVVAHHISLVAVRAESAPYVHPSMDAESRVVLADIADDARRALGELRQVLAVLQRTEDADRAPQPGAADVVALVDAARSAGQSVTVVGDVPVLPPAQGIVLYRAVQESLTNARRHAPGQPVTLALGTGAAPSGTGTLPVPPDGPSPTAGHEARTTVTARVANPLVPRTSPAAPGRGLLGMRERVESIGGSLTAGEEDGSFVVELALPVDGPEPATAAERTGTSLYGHAGDPLPLPDAADGIDA
ncbi:sensor histidine kinase [Oerskovia jenensis]|uniref:histidine kinase n=1 Tax=Oerskovia jenensis TaxID=162169 RepID=A0ABS2LH07_9CELL|nr:histidine kinase [Oerskovia jenensis]MBM7479403.1 signal transduction histidine kinase [Oerskovia jenensis]